MAGLLSPGCDNGESEAGFSRVIGFGLSQNEVGPFGLGVVVKRGQKMEQQEKSTGKIKLDLNI